MKKTKEQTEGVSIEHFIAISIANVMRVSPIPLHITVVVRPAIPDIKESLVLSNEQDFKQTIDDLTSALTAKTVAPLSESIH